MTFWNTPPGSAGVSPAHGVDASPAQPLMRAGRPRSQGFWGLSVIVALFVLLFQGFAPALAEVPAPIIAKPKAEKCVEDTAYMRRNHMEELKHQRDDTMRAGIRTTKHSLKDCLTCHAVEKDGKPVTIEDPQHFCRSCHAYAAVKPDCFQCHSSLPDKKGAK